MEVKTLLIAIAAISLTGCGLCTTTIKTETKDVYIPVPYVPAPPAGCARMELPVDALATETLPEDPVEREKFYGRLAQAYNASVVALQGRIDECAAIVDEYERLSKESKTLDDLIKERAETAPTQ